MSNWLEACVLEHHRWHPDLSSLRVQLPGFDFKAGQFVRLGVDTPEGPMQRAYSLVNPPGEDVLEFLLTPVPDGKVSPRLHALEAGDSIRVSASATGFFTLDELPDGKTLWLIGTGTGIGPYFSILGTPEPWQRFERILLVHGVRRAADLVYPERIRQWQQHYPQRFHYQPVVTREPLDGALSDRLPQLIREGRLQTACHSGFDADSQVMLCGNPQMIREVRSELEEFGLRKNLRRSPGHITAEQYWN